MGLGFNTVRGGIVPKYHNVRARFVGVADEWESVWSGDGAARMSPASRTLANKKSAKGVIISTPYESVSPRLRIVFLSDLLYLVYCNTIIPA